MLGEVAAVELAKLLFRGVDANHGGLLEDRGGTRMLHVGEVSRAGGYDCAGASTGLERLHKYSDIVHHEEQWTQVHKLTKGLAVMAVRKVDCPLRMNVLVQYKVRTLHVVWKEWE